MRHHSEAWGRGYLESGNFLPKPVDCTKEMLDNSFGLEDVSFDVMTACWDQDPAQRPTFDELKEKLAQYLQMISHDNSNYY